MKKILKISAIGFTLSVLAFGFVPTADAATLIVDSISTTPTTGTAPLNDVSVTINISGTATGNATYKVDCTNNGSWDHTNTVNSNTYTASNVCDYVSVGNYTIKYQVEREVLTAGGTTPIVVSASQNQQTCTIPSQNGRTIINFIGDWKLLNTTISHGPTSTSLAAGTYDVTLESYDNHSGHGGQGQTKERWSLKLYDSGSTELFQSSFISDLPENDDNIIELVDTGAVISSAATQISVHHIEQSSADSVYPVCAAFDLQETPTLSVSLTSIPTSGLAPLNDVDLVATASGTATGDIDWKFDCTNDGSWEHEITNTVNPYTIADLCDYPTIGTYTAKVQAERQGLTATDTTIITVSDLPQEPTLSVSLTSIPTSGVAPLNDVDLVATVTGTATGNIDWKFDCTNDGSWEHEITNITNPYTIADLCDYSTVSTFTAMVQAQRQGLTATDTTPIVTTGGGGCTSNCGDTGPTVKFDIIKEVRSITESQTEFSSSLSVKPDEVLEFRITVTNTSPDAVDLEVRDILPTGLSNLANIRLDGTPVTGNLTQGIPTGTISPGASIIILLEATVDSKDSFVIGSNDIINTATAWKGTITKDADLTITVEKTKVGGIATTVSTGGFNPVMFSIILSVLLTLLLSYVLLARFYIKTHFLPNMFRMKSERDLEKSISGILKKENNRF